MLEGSSNNVASLYKYCITNVVQLKIAIKMSLSIMQCIHDTDFSYTQLREACRDICKLTAEGKDINELRKAKQKYIADVGI